MTTAPIENMSTVQGDNPRLASSSSIENSAVLPAPQNATSQIIENPCQQSQIDIEISDTGPFQPLQITDHHDPIWYGAPVEGSTLDQAPVQFLRIEDFPYTGPPIVFKIQLLKNFQIRLLRCHPIGRQVFTWKTSQDQYPWSSKLVVPVGDYDIVLLRRVPRLGDCTNLKYPDSGRQSDMFPGLLPPTPDQILTNWEYCQAHIEDRYPPGIGNRDNPLKALYRLYATIILDYNLGMRMELEYICSRPSWRVHKIPDPKDPDPARYATLAATTSILVLSFNARIKIGLHRDTRPIRTEEERDRDRARKKKWETVPKWAKRVPPLKETLWLPEVEGDGVRDTDHPSTCIPFKEKNILLKNPHFYFT